MATATGTYIAVDELRATLSSTTANYVSEIYATGDTTTAKQVRRMWLNDSSNILTMVWDVWNTVLTASNFNMPSSGGNVEDYISVSSYGTDVDGDPNDLGYSFYPESIDPTTSGSTTTKTVTVTQEGSGESVQVTASIAGRVAQSTTYEIPTVTDTSISTVPASGNVTRMLTVYWSQKKTITYDNGTTSSSTVTGSSTATVISGSENNSSGAYISGGGVYVPSAGTTWYTSQRTAYTISKFEFEANEVSSGTVSKTVYVYQSANTRTQYYRNYKVSLSANPSTVSSHGQTTSISVTSTKESYYSYVSGSTQTIGTVSCNANLTSSDGQFLKSTSYVSSITVANGGSVTFLPNNNTSASSRTVNVKATNADSTSTAYTLEITQKAAEYEFYFKESSSFISSSGGTKELVLVNSLNGGYFDIPQSNFSITNGSVSNVQIDDLVSPMVEWKVTVNVNSNSSSSSRNAVVTATQPTSGKKATHTISQSGVSSAKGSVAITNLVNYLYINGASIDGFNSYPVFTITASGGTVAACSYRFELYFELHTSDGSTINAIYEHELEYIQVSAFSGTTTVRFADFPTFLDMQELSYGAFDPSYMTLESATIRAQITKVSGTGNLYMGGSISDYTWNV